MKIAEDSLILIRSAGAKPLETLLLVLALALGVGAAASGFSLMVQSTQFTKQMMESPEYRQISLSSWDNADEMETASMAINSDTIRLSESDLEAADEVPQVSYSYLAEERSFRLSMGNFPGGERPEGSGGQDGEDQQRREEMQEAAEKMEGQPEPQLDEIYGYNVTPDFFQAWALNTQLGSLFTEQDMLRGGKVMVIGSELAETLFDDGLALDRKVQVFQDIYTIIGVLEESGTVMDKQAFVPLETNENLMGGFRPGGFSQNRVLQFTVEDPQDLEQAAQQLEQWFDQEYGDQAVQISIPREEAERSAARNSNLSLLVILLAMAGLLIATVNVSNILLSRALSRRKTIGILKALGAGRNRIFQLFILEALAIALAGTLLGGSLAMLLAPSLSEAMGFSGISPLSLIAGILIALLITMGLSFFPARQASKTMAAHAIRSE